jgi:hypothetical protein
MPLSFPGSPTVGQQSTQNGRVYSWTGYAWELVAASGGGGLSWSSVPASATATGTAGQIAYDSLGNFYLCTSANTWRRTRLSAYHADYDYTLLLAHFDGNTVDSGPAGLAATVGGSATTSSTTTKFGGGAAYFASGTDNTSNVIKYGSGSAWNLMGADFTLEAWIYATAVNNFSGIITRDNQSDRRNWALMISNDGSKPLFFQLFNAASGAFLTLTDSSACPTNQWVHVAVVRDSGTFRMYRDGVQVASAAASGGTGTLSTASGPLSVGALNENGNYGFTGYIDEVRVLSRCAYPSGTTFTPASSAYLST